MTISEIGAIGEFVAAIAVLVTLIYLAVQIRQTQLAITANTHQALNDISIHLYTSAATSESLANALAASLKEEIELTDTQIQQCRGFWSAMIRNAENMHYQSKIGLLEEERIRASAAVVKKLMKKNLHFQQHWKSIEEGLTPDFKKWMNSMFRD